MGLRTVREVIQPVAAEREALGALEDVISRVPSSTIFCISAPDEPAIPIPQSLYTALKDAISFLLAGSAVVISPLQRRLSTTEAGEVLGISRQYLTRLIDSGALPCERVGRHRRLTLADVLAFKRQRDDRRKSALDDMTAEAAEMGVYD